MELSRQAAIKNMVAADMGVGIVPLSVVKDEAERGKLVRWWIEGARINWEMGLARLSGGYLSPVCQTFVDLCREHFAAAAPTPEPKRRGTKKAGRKGATKRVVKSKK